VARAIAKTEEVGAVEMMEQIKQRGHPATPPAMATDGKGAYREAMVEVWGQVPAYSGRGRPPTEKQPGENWRYLKVVKQREGSRVVAVYTEVIYGEEQSVYEELGAHTAYVERTNLTSRQMNGRLVRKTLSYSKRLKMLKAACAWEDALYNFTRPCQSLRLEVEDSSAGQKWLKRSPAMAAGLSDHIWSVKELLTLVVIPSRQLN
jgi:hypothetical protein